jgi:LmbE family N-acetylglucosaminyl deacetylase
VRLVAQGGASSAQEYFSKRRKEDKLAIENLGNITIENLGFTDAMWRGKSNGDPFYHTIHDQIDKEDLSAQSLEKKLTELSINTSQTIIFGPLARGRHIDHLVVRQVITKMFSHVWYYSDFPYSDKFENEKNFIKSHGLSSVEWNGENENKMKAILAYKTQLFSLFQNQPIKLPREKFYFRPS